MKRLFLLFTFFGFLFLTAQDFKEPVTWSYSVHKVNDVEYDLIFNATIDKDWHVYSQFTPDGGALPTELTFINSGENFELVGNAKESITYTEYSEVFEVDEVFFKDSATITQRIKLLNRNMNAIQGNIFYQACIDKCISRDEDFVFSLDGSAVDIVQKEVDEKSFEITQSLTLPFTNADEIVDTARNEEKDKGLTGIFILGFLGGLIALLTPCVFPMIHL